MKHSKTLEILFGVDRIDALTRAFIDADAAADEANKAARDAAAKAAEARTERDEILADAAGLGIEFVRFVGDGKVYARAIPATGT